MQLLKMSLNNNYFLFDDRLQKKFKVYKLKNMNEFGEMDNLMIKKPTKSSKAHKEQNFEFQIIFEFEISKITFFDDSDLPQIKGLSLEEKLKIM